MDTKDAGSTGAYGRAASTNLLAEARKLAHSQASVSYNPKLSENKAKHVAPVSVVVERPDQLGETREVREGSACLFSPCLLVSLLTQRVHFLSAALALQARR